MEESEKKKYHEELTRKRRIEKGSLQKKQTIERKLNKETIQKKGKKEGKMQNKWPKHTWENRDMSAR